MYIYIYIYTYKDYVLPFGYLIAQCLKEVMPVQLVRLAKPVLQIPYVTLAQEALRVVVAIHSMTPRGIRRRVSRQWDIRFNLISNDKYKLNPWVGRRPSGTLLEQRAGPLNHPTSLSMHKHRCCKYFQVFMVTNNHDGINASGSTEHSIYNRQ